MKTVNKLALFSFMLASLSVTAAEWEIDNAASKLSFLSTKKQNVTEVHHFKQIGGQLTENGSFEVAIELASVDTGIEIRDTRMQDFLFEIAQFAQATLSANIDAAAITALGISQSTVMNVEAQLDLHGQTKPVSFSVLVTKLSENKLLVVSTQPFVLNVSDYALVEGVEKLREIAGLPSISYAVPVSFYLTLNAAN